MAERRKSAQERESRMKLRRRILEILYGWFQEDPHYCVSLPDIEKKSGTDMKTLNWNMRYLEMSGLIELGRGPGAAPYVAAYARITADGIDLIEDEHALNCRFPLAKKNEQAAL
jgi:hypothetical protein